MLGRGIISFLVCIFASLIQQEVFAAQCPDAPTFSSSKLEEITGEWIEVNTLYVKQRDSEDQMEAQSPLCVGYKIESLNNNKMKYKMSSTPVRTVTHATRGNSRNAERDRQRVAMGNRNTMTDGHFRVTEEGEDTVKVESFFGRNSMEQMTQVDDEYDADFYHVLMEMDPEKYMIQIQCRMYNSQKDKMGTLKLLTRRTNDSSPAIDDVEALDVMGRVMRSASAKTAKNIYSSSECFKTTHNYNW